MWQCRTGLPSTLYLETRCSKKLEIRCRRDQSKSAVARPSRNHLDVAFLLSTFLKNPLTSTYSVLHVGKDIRNLWLGLIFWPKFHQFWAIDLIDPPSFGVTIHFCWYSSTIFLPVSSVFQSLNPLKIWHMTFQTTKNIKCDEIMGFPKVFSLWFSSFPFSFFSRLWVGWTTPGTYAAPKPASAPPTASNALTWAVRARWACHTCESGVENADWMVLEWLDFFWDWDLSFRNGDWMVVYGGWYNDLSLRNGDSMGGVDGGLMVL